MGSSTSDHTVLVTADDTTGALESAALIADAGFRTSVVPHPMFDGHLDSGPSRAGAVVVDLRSRHERADVAADRFAGVVRRAPVRVHKIDSTLRGNWPAEIAAAVRVGRRVLMVPAFPAAGRTCTAGVVHEHGVAVELTAHARDPRAPVLTSRPATLLDGAAELATLAQLRAWVDGQGRVAVADASTDADVADAVAAVAGRDDVLLVGPAAVVGVVADAADLAVVRQSPLVWVPEPPVVVVCASVHPISRAQLAALVDAGAAVVPSGRTDGAVHAVSIVTTPEHPAGDPAIVAQRLVERGHDVVRAVGARTVVLIGGDTAEAFLGDRVVQVRGSIGTGIASGSVEVDGRTLDVVSKPGGFGAARTLVDLMHAVFDGSAR